MTNSCLPDLAPLAGVGDTARLAASNFARNIPVSAPLRFRLVRARADCQGLGRGRPRAVETISAAPTTNSAEATIITTAGRASKSPEAVE
jgi:hypothetical protein